MAKQRGTPSKSFTIPAAKRAFALPAGTKLFTYSFNAPPGTAGAVALEGRVTAEQLFEIRNAFLAVESGPGQRERALDVVRAAPEGSVGEAIHSILETATKYAGNIAAGTVGNFYESQRALLNQPATPENIKKFSERETAFFKTQPGLAGLIGGAVSAQKRAEWIQQAAKKLEEARKQEAIKKQQEEGNSGAGGDGESWSGWEGGSWGDDYWGGSQMRALKEAHWPGRTPSVTVHQLPSK